LFAVPDAHSSSVPFLALQKLWTYHELLSYHLTHFNFYSFCNASLSVFRFPPKKVLRLPVPITMSEGAVSLPLLLEYTLPSADDPIFGFTTTDWYEPPSFDMIPPETALERLSRIADETTYRKTTTTTHWHRYAILARHTIEGPWFNEIWSSCLTDPSPLHHLVWYNFMYHVDRKIDIPEKLQSWTISISQPFLSVHYPDALSLDTTSTSWKAFHDKINPWTKVGLNSKPTNPYKRKKSTSPTVSQPTIDNNDKPSRSSSHLLEKPVNPTTILEENEQSIDLEERTSSKSNHSTATQSEKFASAKSNSSSKDAKQSARVPDSHIPLNDGTHRITFRMKMTIDARLVDKQSPEISQSIYNFLENIFHDADGMLYNWNSAGLDE
jgi:hypothetical protein